jgi:hypothetical protein
MKTTCTPLTRILMIPAACLLLAGCGDDEVDTRPDGTITGDPDVGTNGNGQTSDASVTASGGIDAAHTCVFPGCVASFGAIDSGSLHTWQIEIADYTNFHVNIAQNSFEGPVSRPGPGTYDIGHASDADFEAEYSNTEGGLNDDHSYSTSFLFEVVGGTLTIDSSSDERVEGSFEFVAAHIDSWEEPEGTVTVTGTFSAINEDLL